jgi:two-component system, OmpR family, sensor histidine kinase TctE
VRTRNPSLKRPLIVQPLIFQFFVLVASFAAILAVLLRLDSGGRFTDQTLATTVAEAVVRRPDGSLAVRRTPALVEVYRQNPSMWFVAEDEHGRQARFGTVPRQYASITRSLRGIAWADLRDSRPPYRLAAIIRQQDGPAGPLTVMGHGKLGQLGVSVLIAANVVMLPLFLLLGVVAVIVIPWIVRRSLAGLARVAAEAERIDVDRRGIRLAETAVPVEIVPLVRAVNEALNRLDEGYQRQRRFITSAAHELRTPIAILRVKIDAGGDQPARKLIGDVARLSNLAEQLLDLQRLDTDAAFERLDLAELIRGVVADLAPVLIASGQAIEVDVGAAATVRGDATALGRVVTNLVQNAVEHGGGRVIVRVDRSGFEVEDDGPGIPVAERERVFEPFYRLRARSTGTGLGLNLVQEVVARHGGRASILDGPDGGTVVRVDLPRA